MGEAQNMNLLDDDIDARLAEEVNAGARSVFLGGGFTSDE
jgi:hypothetical protein